MKIGDPVLVHGKVLFGYSFTDRNEDGSPKMGAKREAIVAPCSTFSAFVVRLGNRSTGAKAGGYFGGDGEWNPLHLSIDETHAVAWVQKSIYGAPIMCLVSQLEVVNGQPHA